MRDTMPSIGLKAQHHIVGLRILRIGGPAGRNRGALMRNGRSDTDILPSIEAEMSFQLQYLPTQLRVLRQCKFDHAVDR